MLEGTVSDIAIHASLFVETDSQEAQVNFQL